MDTNENNDRRSVVPPTIAETAEDGQSVTSESRFEERFWDLTNQMIQLTNRLQEATERNDLTAMGRYRLGLEQLNGERLTARQLARREDLPIEEVTRFIQLRNQERREREFNRRNNVEINRNSETVPRPEETLENVTNQMFQEMQQPNNQLTEENRQEETLTNINTNPEAVNNYYRLTTNNDPNVSNILRPPGNYTGAIPRIRVDTARLVESEEEGPTQIAPSTVTNPPRYSALYGLAQNRLLPPTLRINEVGFPANSDSAHQGINTMPIPIPHQNRLLENNRSSIARANVNHDTLSDTDSTLQRILEESQRLSRIPNVRLTPRPSPQWPMGRMDYEIPRGTGSNTRANVPRRRLEQQEEDELRRALEISAALPDRRPDTVTFSVTQLLNDPEALRQQQEMMRNIEELARRNQMRIQPSATAPPRDVPPPRNPRDPGPYARTEAYLNDVSLRPDAAGRYPGEPNRSADEPYAIQDFLPAFQAIKMIDCRLEGKAGEDVHAWIMQVKAADMVVMPTQRFPFLSMVISLKTGGALQKTINQRRPRTIPTLLEVIRSAVIVEKSATTLEMELGRTGQKGDTVDAYNLKFNQIYQDLVAAFSNQQLRANIDPNLQDLENRVCQYYLYGLNPRIFHQVKNRQYFKLLEAQKAAKEAEGEELNFRMHQQQLMNSNDTASKSTFWNKSQIYGPGTASDTRRFQVQQRISPNSPRSTPRPPPSVHHHDETKQDEDEGLQRCECHTCNEHRTAHEQQAVCHNCGTKGHYSRNCYAPRRSQNDQRPITNGNKRDVNFRHASLKGKPPNDQVNCTSEELQSEEEETEGQEDQLQDECQQEPAYVQFHRGYYNAL